MKFYNKNGKLFDNRAVCEASNVKASIMNFVNKIKKQDKYNSDNVVDKMKEIDNLNDDAEKELKSVFDKRIFELPKDIIKQPLKIAIETVDDYNVNVKDEETGEVFETINKYDIDETSSDDESSELKEDHNENIKSILGDKFVESTDSDTAYHIDTDGTILDKNRSKVTIESNGDELIMKDSYGNVIDKAPIDERLKIKHDEI